MKNGSMAARLRKRLALIVDELAQLAMEIPVHRAERVFGDIVFVVPDCEWGEPSAEQSARQFALKRKYEAISELLHVLLCKAPNSLCEELRDADNRFRVWLELNSNWSLSQDPATNEKSLRCDAEKLEKIVAVLDLAGARELVLVPDTSALLATADPVQYRSIVGKDTFVFMLLPTVLGELDRHKDEHRNEEVRNKAKKLVDRIKGWRQQGSLHDGVTVDRSITVRASHAEPNMKKTLSWLDESVADDRIIASVLALQAEHPSSRIVLTTKDINLLNKADAALIETA